MSGGILSLENEQTNKLLGTWVSPASKVFKDETRTGEKENRNCLDSAIDYNVCERNRVWILRNYSFSHSLGSSALFT